VRPETFAFSNRKGDQSGNVICEKPKRGLCTTKLTNTVGTDNVTTIAVCGICCAIEIGGCWIQVLADILFLPVNNFGYPFDCSSGLAADLRSSYDCKTIIGYAKSIVSRKRYGMIIGDRKNLEIIFANNGPKRIVSSLTINKTENNLPKSNYFWDFLGWLECPSLG
jgi:hypothetical protein